MSERIEICIPHSSLKSFGKMSRQRKRDYYGNIVRTIRRVGRSAPVRVGLSSLGRSFTSPGRLRRSYARSGQGVTFEHDRQRVYRRKRMPRKKKRRWIKMIKRNDAIDLKKCGAQTYVFNTSFTNTNTTSTFHGFVNVSLYGAHDASTSYNNDLHYIGENENELDSTATLGVTVAPSTKLFFQSAVLDVTIRNASVQNFAAGNIAAGTLEVDVYEVTSKKKWSEFDKAGGALVEYGDVGSIFTEAAGDTLGINNSGSDDYRLRGMTPWDMTYALSRYGIKIHKKTKYRISAGNTITYQCRDPKNRAISYQALNEIAGGNKPGWTKWILVYYKLIPGLTVGTSEGAYTISISVGVTRKYMYKVQNRTEKRTSHQAR